jgi:hypothetical protein
MSALTRFQPKLTAGHLRYHIDEQKVIDGYLECDGSIVLRDSYPVLFNEIGAIINSDIANGVLQTSGTSNNITALLYANNTFVYATDNGIIGTSANASIWTPRNSVIESGIQPVYAGGKTSERNGSTSTTSLSLTDLTGGTSTAPTEGDIVFIAVATGANAEFDQAVTGYTQLTSRYVNDTYDTNLWVGYKVMGTAPDTTVEIPSTGSTLFAQTIAIQVWRNVEIVSAASVTQLNTVLANPPSITTTTANNVLLVIGAGGHIGGIQTYTAAYLSNFLTVGSSDTFDSTIGFGSINRPTAGAYDPAAFTFSAADGVDNSAAAVTIALKPASNIKSLTYGNNTFVFTGTGGVLATSSNAVTWTLQTSGTSNNINALVYANNTFVYAGAGGVLATSANAVTWTQRTSGTSSNINALVYANNTFVYAGDNGVLATSPDAITWTQKQIYSPITYVGGKTFLERTGVSLTDLTGGIASQPAAGDMVIVVYAENDSTDKGLSVLGYNKLIEFDSVDSSRTNFYAGYKIMGDIPDTSFDALGADGNGDIGAIQVWRNVGSLLFTQAALGDTAVVNPPPITTTTSNNVLAVIGVGSHTAAGATYTAAYLSNFLTAGVNETQTDVSIGSGSIALPSAGFYNPAAWTFSGSDSSAFSTAAVTIALIPKNDNYKSLSYGNNTFVCSTGSSILTSSDANTWTPISSGSESQYVGGKAVGRLGSTSITATPLTDLGGPRGTTSAGAGDIVFIAISVSSNTPVSQAVTGYTEITSQTAAASLGTTNLWVGYKVMGDVPDTEVEIPSTGSALFAQTIAIQVWRNVEYGRVSIDTATNTFLPNPPAETTYFDNDIILAIGAAAHDRSGATGANFTAPDLENFVTRSIEDTFSSVIGMGSIAIPKVTTYDPEAFSFPGFTDSVFFSSVGVTIVLKNKNINSITYDYFDNKFAFATSLGIINYSNLISWLPIDSKSLQSINSITYAEGFLLYAGQSGIIGTASNYTYDPNIEYILPTSRNVFDDSFNSFTPTAFIKYE